MNTTPTDTNLVDLIFEPLVTSCELYTYGYGYYGEFKIIIRSDGYVNATKLCAAGGQKYYKWAANGRSQRYIAFLTEKLVSPNSVQPLTDVIFIGGSNPIDLIVCGTYVHKKLITMIAQWVSDDFAYMVDEIVSKYIDTQHKAAMAKLEHELALQNARLLLNEGVIVAKDEQLVEKTCKIDELKLEIRNLIIMVKGQSDDVADSKIIIQRSNDKLDEVLEKNDVLIGSNIELLEDTKVLIEKNDLICLKLGIAVETRVPLTKTRSDDESLAVFTLTEPVGALTHYISCGKAGTIKQCIRKFGAPVFQIKQQPNSKNLFQRVKEIPGVIVHNGSNIYPVNGIESFTKLLTDVNDEKYVVEVPKVDPYKALTVIELKTICTGKKIKGHSKCKRAELIKLIEDNGGL